MRLAGIVFKDINDKLVVDENSIVTLSFIITSDTCPSPANTFEILVDSCRDWACTTFCKITYTNGFCNLFAEKPPEDCGCGLQTRQFTVRRRVNGAPGEDWRLRVSAHLKNGDHLDVRKRVEIHVRCKSPPPHFALVAFHLVV